MFGFCYFFGIEWSRIFRFGMELIGNSRWDKGIQQMTLGTAKQESGDLVGAAQHYETGIQMMIDHLKTLPQSDRKLVKQAKVESYMDILESVKQEIAETNPNDSIKLENRIAKPKPRKQQQKVAPRAKLPKPKARNLTKTRSHQNSFNSSSNVLYTFHFLVLF